MTMRYRYAQQPSAVWRGFKFLFGAALFLALLALGVMALGWWALFYG